MARDLEEFLRRAAQRRTQQTTGQPPQRPAAREPIVEMEVVDQPRTLAPKHASDIGAPSAPRNLGTAASQGAASPSVDLADERMDEHLHESFDHGLGDLAAPTHTETASDSSGGQVAASNVIQDLVDMLRDPAGIQKAVLLKEILDRPVNRWN